MTDDRAQTVMEQALESLQAGVPPQDVADMTGMTLQDVYAVQRGLKAARGVQTATARDEQIVAMYRTGFRILDIENAVGVAPATVYRALSKGGVPGRRAHKGRPNLLRYVSRLEDWIEGSVGDTHTGEDGPGVLRRLQREEGIASANE